MATRRKYTDEEIVAQIPAAKARATEQRRHGIRAATARYDSASGRVIVETTKGYLLGFPVADVAALKGASSAALRRVVISPSGSGLHWEELDVDLDVASVIVGALGRDAQVRELARLAGSVSSERKAAAARLNGAKGGRPRAKGTKVVVAPGPRTKGKRRRPARIGASD
jgi:hypothetical protein